MLNFNSFKQMHGKTTILDIFNDFVFIFNMHFLHVFFNIFSL